MKEEVWKDVKGYEGLYQVSSLGRVKSLDRSTNHYLGGKSILKGRMLKLSPNNQGYLIAGLSRDGKSKKIKVHKLVAVAFLGHTPCGYNIIVDHVDNERLNNIVENLQLITPRENSSKDKFRQKRTSEHIGVGWANGKWYARISIDGNHNHLGRFVSELEAANEYQKVLSIVNSESSEYVQKYIKDNYTPKYSSQYKGVYWNKEANKWNAEIQANGKSKKLGYFTDELKASEAYQKVLSVVNSEPPEYVQKYIQENYTKEYSSKHKGVSWKKNRKKWYAQIHIEGENKYLGSFTSELDAANAYLSALKEKEAAIIDMVW